MEKSWWSLRFFLIFALVASVSGYFAPARAGNNAGGAFSLWPDTGQTKCYDNSGEIPCPSPGEPFYGQDAQYQGPPRSYTKLGYGGVELPDTATPADGWIMTRDNVTGLIWEIKTDDGSIHDKDNYYTWCDHNPDTNGGDQGTCGDGTDTEDFIAALNAAHFGGYSDWRLPTIKELSTLVNSNIPWPGPTIDAAYFPNTVSSDYWSSTTHAYYTDSAWLVNFSYGYVHGEINYNYKVSYHYVRAVRSGQSHTNRFIDNHDGTITDTATGLMWQKCSMGQSYNPATNGCDGSANIYTWQEALAVCEDLVLAGYDDWRPPDRNELQSIVDYSRYNPAIDTNYFPGTVSSLYWSSTTNAYITNYAWLVPFHSGCVHFGYKAGGFVRAVRSGQSGSFGDLVIDLQPINPQARESFYRNFYPKPYPEKLKYGGAPSSIIAADGQSRLLLRIKANKPAIVTLSIGSGNISDGTLCKLSNAFNGCESRTSVVIQVNKPTFDGYIGFAVYRSPRDFYPDDSITTLTRPISINAIAGEKEWKVTLDLRRPPIILSHGLWSSPDALHDFRILLWEQFSDTEGKNIDEYIYINNAEPVNSNHFDVGTRWTRLSIENYLRSLRSKGITVTQVDYVGHSMGGIWGRLLQEKYSRNFLGSSD